VGAGQGQDGERPAQAAVQGGLYVFAPGGIQPLHGVRSKTAWVQAIYVVGVTAVRVARTDFAGICDDDRAGRPAP